MAENGPFLSLSSASTIGKFLRNEDSALLPFSEGENYGGDFSERSRGVPGRAKSPAGSRDGLAQNDGRTERSSCIGHPNFCSIRPTRGRIPEIWERWSRYGRCST